MPSGAAGSWDVVIGVCESQINDVIAQVCTIYPGFFNTIFPYSDGTLVAVGVTFEQAPTVSLAPSEDYLSLARSHAAGLGATADVNAAALGMTQACGTFTCQNVRYNLIGMKTGTFITGSITCSMALNVTADRLSMSFSDCHVDMPGAPAADPGLVPMLQSSILYWLYEKVTLPFQIPLALPGGGNFMPFAVVNDENHGDVAVLAFTGFAPVVLPDGPGQWPEQATFIAVDAAVIDALANANIQPVAGTGGISDPNFSWDWHATLTCNADLQQSSGTNVEVGLGVTGGASITYHMPNGIPNPTIGASISGSCSANATLSITNNLDGESLRLLINSVGGFDLKVDLGSCPSVIADVINDCISPLINDIASAVTGNVPGTWYDLFTIPPLTITPGDLDPLTISLQNFTPQILIGPGGVNVLGLGGRVSVTKR